MPDLTRRLACACPLLGALHTARAETPERIDDPEALRKAISRLAERVRGCDPRHGRGQVLDLYLSSRTAPTGARPQTRGEEKQKSKT